MVFMIKKSKIQYSYTNMLRISSLEGDHDRHYVIFYLFADVNTRKNFDCINFGVRVDSCRQVKLL